MAVPEADEGIWGGEHVIYGYQKGQARRRPSHRAHWWFPSFFRSTLYCEVLDTHLSTVVTRRALELIDKHTGLDNYLFETSPQDLHSLLALKLKQRMYLALADGDLPHSDPGIRKEVFSKYEKYAIPAEEAEWFGLTLEEACRKQEKLEREAYRPTPKKAEYRLQLLNKLQQLTDDGELNHPIERTTHGFLSRLVSLNPFAKKDESGSETKK